MNVKSLYFFDKLGKNQNNEYDSDVTLWKGTIYYETITAYLL